MKIGSHVGMSGKEMLLGSAKEAVSYGADTFMFYTGAPQNTRRKEISELNIEPAWEYMRAHGIREIVVHAPYIINLGNAVKPETFSLAVEFLAKEIDRTVSCKSRTLILHPGAHVGEGAEIGTKQIIKGLNEVLTSDMDCCVALETMAGKGSEIGRTFEELARIYDGVKYNDKLRVCFDTCHTSDSGYDIIHHFDDVIETILMGMFYAGQYQTMMPKLHSDNYEGMELIRPLYLIREADVLRWCRHNDLSFIRCACKFTEDDEVEHFSKRKEIKDLIAQLHQVNPYVEKNIFKSSSNVNLGQIIAYFDKEKTYHFLDTYDEEKKHE